VRPISVFFTARRKLYSTHVISAAYAVLVCVSTSWCSILKRLNKSSLSSAERLFSAFYTVS